MAGNALPLLLAAGFGAVLLTKKKAGKAKGKGNGVVDSGKVERTSVPKSGESPLAYEWRVRRANGVYAAEAGRPESLRDPVVKKWVHIGEADTVGDARVMVLAWIGQQVGYESEAEVVEAGVMSGGGWQWRVITDPERGYIGQYKIGEGPWLNAVIAGVYDQAMKYKMFEIGEKAYIAAGG